MEDGFDDGPDVGVHGIPEIASERRFAVTVADRLTRLSADEMVAALGLGRGPGVTSRVIRAAAQLPFWVASRPIGKTLARFDAQIARDGLPDAARRALQAFGVRVIADGTAPPVGPLLVLTNHPGAYDALALMATLGRTDLLILAGDRGFLRALPTLSRHLVFLPDTARGKAAGLKRALRHLRAGGAILQFAAGQIEPDPAFVAPGEDVLAPWMAGTGVLVRATARARGQVMVAGVEGVHSARAKRFLLTRAAERRGVTTFAPLLQIAARLTDVTTRVHFGDAHDAAEFAGADGDRAITDRARDELQRRLASRSTRG